MAISVLAQEHLADKQVEKEGHLCGSCGEHTYSRVPLYLLHIGRAGVQYDASGRPSQKIEALLLSDGSYRHQPYFLHEDCWDEAKDSLQELHEDQPAVKVDASKVLVFAECLSCGSHILTGEVMGVIYAGELSLSPRVPSGQWALDFETVPPFEYVCLPCLNDINMTVIENLWGEGQRILQNNECSAGIMSRCWRNGACDQNAGYCTATKG
jgi:hypothetical protein